MFLLYTPKKGPYLVLVIAVYERLSTVLAQTMKEVFVQVILVVEICFIVNTSPDMYFFRSPAQHKVGIGEPS